MPEQICLVPRLQGLGGMVSFQAKFIQELDRRGIDHSFDPADPLNTAILVIGGTRHLLPLLRARRRGLHIVQRLNGMNWLHKVQKTNLQSWLRSVNANNLLNFIRRYVCNEIIYQSEFSRTWWESEHGGLNKLNHVVYNGVDLNTYSPIGEEEPAIDRFSILLVEGHLTQASAGGLEIAMQLVKSLRERLILPVELIVVGDVLASVQVVCQQKFPSVNVHWTGIVPHTDIPTLDRSAHLLFSADLNAACPNSVLEALACGLPVLAYDTGSLSELIQEGAGSVVPWGSNYWRLEPPDLPALVEAAILILQNNGKYRQAARQRAEQVFSLEAMVDAYLEVLLK